MIGNCNVNCRLSMEIDGIKELDEVDGIVRRDKRDIRILTK